MDEGRATSYKRGIFMRSGPNGERARRVAVVRGIRKSSNVSLVPLKKYMFPEHKASDSEIFSAELCRIWVARNTGRDRMRRKGGCSLISALYVTSPSHRHIS